MARLPSCWVALFLLVLALTALQQVLAAPVAPIGSMEVWGYPGVCYKVSFYTQERNWADAAAACKALGATTQLVQSDALCLQPTVVPAKAKSLSAALAGGFWTGVVVNQTADGRCNTGTPPLYTVPAADVPYWRQHPVTPNNYLKVVIAEGKYLPAVPSSLLPYACMEAVCNSWSVTQTQPCCANAQP